METEQIVTVLLCIGTIAKAGEVLQDTLEVVEKHHMDDMPEKGRRNIYAIEDFCIDTKKEVAIVEDRHLESMREIISADDENEIEEAVLRIEDILLDDSVPTVSTKTFNPHSISDVAKACGLSTVMDDEVKESRKMENSGMVECAKKAAGFSQF